MGLNPEQLREYIIHPTLKFIAHHSKSAEELLMLTAAAESELGYYIHQVGGPALGIYQMEPATHDDIWGNWLKYKAMAGHVSNLGTQSSELVSNLAYATAMARCHYLRVPEALPNAHETQALARYWKEYYNTEAGAGTVEKAVQKYREYV